MPKLAYLAIDRSGRTLRGVEDVASPSALARMLSERKLYLLEVKDAKSVQTYRGKRWRGSRGSQVAEAISTLAVLLDAGMTLDAALEVTARGTSRQDLTTALVDARQQVRQGTRLAESLRSWPQLFPPIVLGLIHAGEEGGALAETMKKLAEHLDRQQMLRARILSALLYPVVLLATGIAAMGVLVVVILPSFVSLLQDSGADIPRSTAMILTAATFLRTNVTLIGVISAGFLVGIASWVRTEGGRKQLDELLIRMPLIAGVRIDSGSARVARTLACLLSSGTPLLSSLQVSASAAGDHAMVRWLQSVHQQVRTGDPLSAALASHPFPGILVRLVKIGEEGGRLESLLDRAASLLESGLERRLHRFITVLEPVLILMFGIGVGFVALSLLQAIYGVHANGT